MGVSKGGISRGTQRMAVGGGGAPPPLLSAFMVVAVPPPRPKILCMRDGGVVRGWGGCSLALARCCTGR